MTSALIYLVVVIVVATVVYLLAALVFGRGEELAPLPSGSTPTRLPPERVEGSDVRTLRFQQTVRGYKVSEVDWVLARVANELDELRGQVATLERQLDLAEERIQHANATEQTDEHPPVDQANTDSETRPGANDGGDTGIEEPGHTAGDQESGTGTEEPGRTAGDQESDTGTEQPGHTAGHHESGTDAEEPGRATGDQESDTDAEHGNQEDGA